MLCFEVIWPFMIVSFESLSPTLRATTYPCPQHSVPLLHRVPTFCSTHTPMSLLLWYNTMYNIYGMYVSINIYFQDTFYKLRFANSLKLNMGYQLHSDFWISKPNMFIFFFFQMGHLNTKIWKIKEDCLEHHDFMLL
jgi:hypothetical protein